MTRAGGTMALAAGALMLSGAAPSHEVSVSVSGLRSTKGVVRACMTGNAARFPKCAGDPASYRLVIPAKSAGKLVFKGVTPGRYAIALLHDENDNARLDRFMAMPREGFGFSRNPAIRMGPPRFEEVRFQVGGAVVAQVIRMKYLL